MNVKIPSRVKVSGDPGRYRLPPRPSVTGDVTPESDTYPYTLGGPNFLAGEGYLEPFPPLPPFHKVSVTNGFPRTHEDF